MGKVGRFIVGVVLVVGGVMTGQGWLSAIGVNLITGAAIEALQSFFQRQEALLSNPASTAAPIPIVYGLARVGGPIVDQRLHPSQRDVLYVVIAISVASENGSGIDDVVAIYFDDEIAVANPVFGSLTTTGVQPKYSGKLQYAVFLGTDSQTNLGSLTSTFPTEWPNTADGRGIAYCVLRLVFDKDVFPSGLPTITFDVRGNKVFDPRTSQTLWSENPALIVRDYLTSSKYGCGIDSSEIDDASFIAAANYCEEIVNTGAYNGKRFTCNGALSTATPRQDVLSELLSSCRGDLVYQGGKFRLLIRRPTVQTAFELNEDNIIGEWNFVRAGADVPNSITASYPDPDHKSQPRDVTWPEAGQANAFLTADNNIPVHRSITLPFTTSRFIAQQIAMVTLREARKDVTVALTAKEEALQLQVGDVVPVTHSTPGWTDKLFWVAAITILPDATVRLVLREYDANAYTLDTQSTQPTVPGSDLPDPFTCAPPASLTLTSDDTTAIETQDGNYLPRILVEWGASPDPFVVSYEIRYRRAGATAWEMAPAVAKDTLQAFLTPVTNGITYEIELRAVNTIGVRSSAVSGSVMAAKMPAASLRSASITFNDADSKLYAYAYGDANSATITFEIDDDPTFASPKLSTTVATDVTKRASVSTAALSDAERNRVWYLRATPNSIVIGPAPTPMEDSVFVPSREERGVNLVRNGDAEEGTNWGFSGLSVVEVPKVARSGRYVFQKTGTSDTIVGDQIIPVDPSKAYHISAKMRYTAGANPPHAYLGLVPLDSNGVQIHARTVNPVSLDIYTLTSTASDGATSLQVSGMPSLPVGVACFISLNAEEDGSDLPNREQYQIASVVGNTVNLTLPLVQAYPSGTKFRVHRDGQTYMYSGASNVALSQDWTEYSGRVEGERDIVTGGLGSAQFWPGTRYVRILLLLNRDAGGPATTQIDQIEFMPLSFISSNTDVVSGVEGRRRVDTYYKGDGKLLPAVTWERSGVDELPTAFFKCGSDTLDDVTDGSSYRRVIADYVSSGRIVRLRRDGIDELPNNLFKRNENTLDEVVDGVFRKKVLADYVDTGGRIQRVRRAGTDEVPDNLFKRGSNTLSDVLDDGFYRRVTNSYVDANGRVRRLVRSGVDELPENLAKHGSSLLNQLVGSELPPGCTLNGRTTAQLATDSAIDDAANLVFNGSFEAAYVNTEIGLADGWSVTGSTGGGASFSAGSPRHGARGQTVTPANASSGVFIGTRPFAVRPGNKYRVSVDVFNHSGSEADGFYLRVTWWDATQSFISQTDVVGGASSVLALNGWSEQDGVAEAPANARFCRVYLGCWTQRAGAALTFDRCHVTDESAYLGGSLSEDGGGELKPTVRQAGKVLAKGLIEWSGRHGDSIVFPADFFSSIPAVLTRPSGSTYAPAGAGWTPSFDATKRQYQRVIFQDLDAEGFTLVAQMYQKTAVITQRTRDRGSWLLDALNETIDSLGLESFSGSPTPPAYDNTYYAQYEIEIGGFHDPLKPWVEYRTEVDVTLETSSDGGTTWTPRHTRTHIWTNLGFGGAGSEVVSGQLQATASGLGTGDRLRIRISRLETHVGAIHNVRPKAGSTYDFWYYTAAGTKNVTSMTPDADDFIYGSAMDVAGGS